MGSLEAREEGRGPLVRVTTPTEGDRSVRSVRGETVLDLCTREGILLDAPCGGRGSCGRCRVEASGSLSDPDEAERGLGLEGEARLACRCRILGEARVALPDPSLEGASKLGEDLPEAGPLREDLRTFRFSLPWEDLFGRADVASALTERLRDRGVREVAPDALSRVCASLVPGGTVELHGRARGNRLTEAAPDPLSPAWGLALDLGTSTLAGSVVDLSTGSRLAAGTLRNPLAPWGADLGERLAAAADPEVFPRMVEALREGVLEGARGWCASAGGELGNLRGATAGGNGVLTALYLGLSPRSLARTPFVPPCREGMERDPIALGLPFPGVLRVFPGIGGFVGGDATALLLALEALPPAGIRVAVDLGTNGEVLLVLPGKVLGTSAAAGPAFEGGRISCGCPAVAGAVRGVRFTPRGLRVETVGDRKPRGLCGSGLLSLAARLGEAEALDPFGRLREPGEVDPSLRDRLVRLPSPVPGGHPLRAFRFCDDPPLYLTQGDLRELRLATGALRAALEVTLLRGGVREEQVEECVLAGAFGAGISREDAVRAGVLPQAWEGRIRVLGAGALLGLERALREGDRAWDRVRDLARRAEHIPLEGDRDFEARFLRALSLSL